MTISYQSLLKRLLGVIVLDQTYTTLALPIVTLIFFDPASSLFEANTPHAIRSMWYGFCISTPYFINLFFAPLLSSLSDEFGRKKMLLFEISSACLYTLLSGLGVLFGQLWLVIVSYIVRGAFSRTNTTALSIIGDVSPKDKKLGYMSNLQTAIAIGACAGPIIGGLFAGRFFFSTLNFSLPFFLAATIAGLNIISAYTLIHETLVKRTSEAWGERHDRRITANLQAAKYVMTHPSVLKTSLILLLIQISWSTYYHYIAPLLKTCYAFNAHQLGLFMGMVSFWLIVGSGPIFKVLRHKVSPYQILNLGTVLVLSGYALTIATFYHVLPGTWTLWVAAAPIAIGDVMTYICLTTLYSNSVPEHMQGKVMGINFIVIGLVWGLSGLVGGLLTSYTPALPLLIAPLGAILALMTINATTGRELILENSQ